MLGTEANVRVLRVLSALGAPISAPELARRAALQRSSVHRAVKSLEETGIVSYVGTAAQPHVSLRNEHPLTKPVRTLFDAERRRHEELLNALKEAASDLEYPPRAVWIEGLVASGNDRPGDPLILAVVDDTRRVAAAAEALRVRLEALQSRYDVLIEVRSRTQADLDTLEPAEAEALLDAVPLLGLPPGGVLGRYKHLWAARNISSHADHDARGLAYGRAIADAIAKDPSLLEEARRYLARRWRNASTSERRELAEWKQLLTTASPSAIRKLLTDPGERATRLRQSIPFLGVFSTERPRTS